MVQYDGTATLRRLSNRKEAQARKKGGEALRSPAPLSKSQPAGSILRIYSRTYSVTYSGTYSVT